MDSTEEEGAPSAQLAAADVASVLRCLAAAERLPALNFGTLCRRLLRSHPGSAAVEEGCIALAAAHGQVRGSLPWCAFSTSSMLCLQALFGTQQSNSLLIPCLPHFPRLFSPYGSLPVHKCGLPTSARQPVNVQALSQPLPFSAPLSSSISAYPAYLIVFCPIHQSLAVSFLVHLSLSVPINFLKHLFLSLPGPSPRSSSCSWGTSLPTS